MFKYQDLQLFVLKLNKCESFSSTKVVGRKSETQLQVGEKDNLANKESRNVASTDIFKHPNICVS